MQQGYRLSCLFFNITLEGVMRRAGAQQPSYDFYEIRSICVKHEPIVLYGEPGIQKVVKARWIWWTEHVARTPDNNPKGASIYYVRQF